MKLTERLKTIADVIDNCNIIADIGTDHGYIPIFCVKNNMAKGAIACDVNMGPLKIAQENIKKYNLEKCITTRLSDGLMELKKGEADVVVIAGMGGLLIRDIIEAGKSKITDSTLMLIQPMIAPAELRSFLFENGFNIIDEYVVREENKFYNIFAVKKGNVKPTEENIFIGKNLASNSPQVYNDYLSYKIRVTEKILSGMEKAENPDTLLIEKYKHELEIYSKHLRRS